MLIPLGIVALFQLSVPILMYRTHKHEDRQLAMKLTFLWLLQAIAFISLCSISFIKMFKFPQ